VGGAGGPVGGQGGKTTSGGGWGGQNGSSLVEQGWRGAAGGAWWAGADCGGRVGEGGQGGVGRRRHLGGAEQEQGADGMGGTVVC